MKKLITLILALALVLSLSLTAFAASGTSADTTGTINIENTVEGKEYKVYRIFELESFDTEREAYAYKLDENWGNNISNTCLGDYIEIDEDGYVTWKDDADVADFMGDILADLEDWEPDDSATAAADNETITFSDLPLGYYVVESSLGSIVALNTPDATVTVTEKNSAHGLEKQVKEGSDWGAENNSDVLVSDNVSDGRAVEYKITIDIEGKAEDLLVHDTMSTGLSFLSSSVVGYLNAESGTDNVIADTNYTVSTECTDGCTFHITIDSDYCKTLKSDDTVVFTYSAVLNENALTTGAETNKAKLQYGNTNTQEVTTTTYTYKFEIVKTDVADEVIDGAKFELYSDEDCTKQIKLVKVEETDGSVYYRRAATSAETSAAVSIEAGRAVIKGLDEGTYYLKETMPPEGYNKLDEATKIEITADNMATVETVDGVTTYIEGGVRVINETGILLPSFGGMGTTVFYVLGGAMVLAAIVLLVTKKRMSVQN